MTNFDFLKKDKRFESFADVAIAAENILHIDVASCVINCRRAMEFAVKWMYSVDRDLVMPYQDNLVSLMNDEKFRDIIGNDIWRRMEFIRKLGNNAAHGGKKVTQEQAELCLENLFVFLDCIAYFYAPEYTEQQFDKSLLELTVDEALSFVPENEIDIAKLIEENKALKDELTARRATADLRAQASRPLRVQDEKDLYRLYASRCRLDRGQGLAERGRALRYAQQERGRICRLRSLR